MFYCEPCRVEKEWPEAISQSYGRCEVCGRTAICNDKASKFLPLPKAEPITIKQDRRWDGTEGPARAKDRIDQFLELFTDKEKESWEGKSGRIPNWVVLGVAYFLAEEPATKELMKRLKESGD